MASKRVVAALTGDGRIVPIEQDMPPVKAGMILVEVHRSLVSPGTELGGFRALQEQRKKPVAQAAPRPFGYSNAGVVLEVGAGVTDFRPGDRVACIGAGFAQHTDYAVVPHHLCIALPATVTFAQGAYAMLAATGLQALRRGAPEFGEYTAIVGLGLVGQLTARLYQLAGNYVMGWDTIPMRLEIAKRWGADATVRIGAEDAVAATQAFTGQAGLDAAVIAFGGDGTKAYETVLKCMKLSPDTHRMGRVVVVGGAAISVAWAPANIDLRFAARTGAGYHDDAWETGPDYPPVFMRWTTRTNLALCMRLMAEGKLAVDALTTHTISLHNVEAEIDRIIGAPDAILGLVFAVKP